MKLLRLIISSFFIIACLSAFAQTSTSWKGTTSTAWATASNWTNGVPTNTIDAVIGDANFTGTFQPKITGTAYSKSLTLGGGSVAVTLTQSNTLYVQGDLNINTNAAVVHTYATLYIKGNFNNNGSYTASGTSTQVTCFGTTQSITGTGTNVFQKLIINSGSILTLTSNLSSAISVTVSGTLIPGDSPTYLVTSPLITVNSGGVLTVNAATIDANYSVLPTLLAGSVVEYASSTRDQVVSSSLTYSTLKISGTTVKRLTANLPDLLSTTSTVGRIYNYGIFDLGKYTANRGTTVTGGYCYLYAGSKLIIGGEDVSFYPANFSSNSLNATSTVEYNGGGTQLVRAFTYGNLVLSSTSGNAIKTMPATNFSIAGNFTTKLDGGTSLSATAASNISISGDISIGSGTVFDGGTFAHTVKGNWVNEGTLSGNASTFTISGAAKTISGAGLYNFNTLSITGTGYVVDPATIISINGNVATSTLGTISQAVGAGSFNFTGAGKSIAGTGFSLYNINVNTTGIVTLNAAAKLTVAGNFNTQAGTFNSSSTSTLYMTGVGKTIQSTGTLTLGNVTIDAAADVTTSSDFSIIGILSTPGLFTATSGTLTFKGSSAIDGKPKLNNVTINGTSLQLYANAELGVAGTLLRTAGTFNVTSTIPNTVNFNSSAAQSMYAGPYNNLTLSGGSTKTPVSAVTVYGDFTIGSAITFDAKTFSHIIYGDWVNNGAFIPGTSTVTLGGVADATVSGTNTFNTLTINKTAFNQVTLLNDVTTTVVNMTLGTLQTGTNKITITSTRNGNSIILGIIERIHTFTTGVAYAFEGPANTVKFTSVTGVTSVKVKVTSGAVADFSGAASINREYQIEVPAGTYNATLRLHYEDAELNGNNEASMQFWRNTGTGWLTAGKTANDAGANYVEKSGLIDITKRWTISETVNVVGWNGSVSSDWTNAANWTVVSGSPALPPSSSEIVQLGNQTVNYQPVISTPVTVRGISFSSVQAINLSLASGGSLQTLGGIQGIWTADVKHSIAVGDQSLVVNGGMILSTGDVNRAINVTVGTGSVAVAGDLIQYAGADINYTGAGTLSLGGNYTHNGGVFNQSAGGTVTYNGTGLQLAAVLPYYNLKVNKSSGIVSIKDSALVTNNLTVSAGELDLYNSSVIGGNLNIVSGTLVAKGTFNYTINGNWQNTGTFTAGTSTVILNGTSAQTIDGTPFYNLTINKPAGVVASLLGNSTTKSTLAVKSGTLDLGAYTLDRYTAGGSFIVSPSVLVLVGGASNFPANYSTRTLDVTSTVIYNAASDQKIASVSYGNLICNNAGTKSLLGLTTVRGDLTIASGITMKADSFNINLYGNWENAGTFIPEKGIVTLLGTTKTINGATDFYQLVVKGRYSVINSSTINYKDSTSVTSTGIYDMGTGTSFVKGDLTNDGSLTCGGICHFTGLVEQKLQFNKPLTKTTATKVFFDGNVAPVCTYVTAPTFPYVGINNTAPFTIGEDWTVTGRLIIGNGASFTVPSTNTVTAKTIRIEPAGHYDNEGTTSISDTILFAANDTKTAQFLNNGTVANSGVVRLEKAMLASTGWYFMSFPFDVSSANITNASTGASLTWGTDFYVKKYDGYSRDLYGNPNLTGSGAYWVLVNPQQITQYEGYIVASEGDKIIAFTSAAGESSLFASTTSVSVNKYVTNASILNQSWNLRGNPFSSGYDLLYATQDQAPFYVYDGYTYQTIMPGDSYSLYPFAGYFLQAIGANSYITFNTTGQSFKSAQIADEYDEVDLTIDNGTNSDRVRLRVKEDASLDYEAGIDGLKMLSMRSKMPQLYSRVNEMNYSVNTLPPSSTDTTTIPLSLYTGVVGSYTIRLAHPEKIKNYTKAILTDSEAGTSINMLTDSVYTLTASTTGTTHTRLAIILEKESTTTGTATATQIGSNNGIQLQIKGQSVSIAGLDGKADMQVIDVAGRVIGQYNDVQNNTTINIGSTGVYVISIKTATQSLHKKILITK